MTSLGDVTHSFLEAPLGWAEATLLPSCSAVQEGKDRGSLHISCCFAAAFESDCKAARLVEAGQWIPPLSSPFCSAEQEKRDGSSLHGSCRFAVAFAATKWQDPLGLGSGAYPTPLLSFCSSKQEGRDGVASVGLPAL